MCTAEPAKNVSISEITDDGIAIITLDCAGAKMNTLNEGLNSDFEEVLGQLQNDSRIKSAVLISGKPDNWVAGADITMLAKCKTAEELSGLSRNGQKMLQRLEDSKTPVVAAINGACLGGGLELALACHYRIATTNSKTVLGVPEVKLGLLPGAGGTQRLPKLVGIQNSLTLALQGKFLKADKAKRMGLVDQVADPFALKHAALLAARGLADKTLRSKPKKKNLVSKILENNPLGRQLLFKKAGEMVAKTAGSHYPAPFAILDCIRTGADKGSAAGYAVESQKFGELGMTSVSESLRGIFFGQQKCTKNSFGKPAREAETVAVLGAGLMGAGIAQVSAQKGYNVVLKDQNLAGLARGEAQIANNLAPRVKRRQMTAFDRDVVLSNVIGVTAEDASWKKHLSTADVVVEAVFEDLSLKHRVIEEIEPLLADHAVFATNTSALPIAEIAKAAKKPERVLGMHYFSPVDKMPLLEIITHEGTSNEAAALATSVGLKQGKTVIVVKDVPGFFVNRCLAPFMVEAIALLQEGVPAEKLDKTLKAFGFPVGPITLSDEVGIDVATHVAAFMNDKLGNRMDGADPAVMKSMVDAGLLGRKTGKGFFVYGKGKSKSFNPQVNELLKPHIKSDKGASYSTDEIAERMVLRYMNEAFHCLQDEIISGPVDGDIGSVFGMGFPPFLGGPFRYADQLGAQNVVDSMNRYAETVGEHFRPAQILVDTAKAGKKFHSE